MTIRSAGARASIGVGTVTDTSGSRPAARAARKLSVLLALPALLAACGSTDKEEAESPPVLAFAVAPIRLVAGTDTLTLVAELAENDQQRALGLMERRHLADSAGMLFLYPADTSADAGYWMFRTRIPLDIAYVEVSDVSAGRALSRRARGECWIPCAPQARAGRTSHPGGYVAEGGCAWRGPGSSAVRGGQMAPDAGAPIRTVADSGDGQRRNG